MNESTVATRQPVACDDCLERGQLLAHLAPYIERDGSGVALADLLALSSEDLCEALGVVGASVPKLPLPPRERMRQQVSDAGCWSICEHLQADYPIGLRSLANVGAIYGRGDVARLEAIRRPSEVVSVVGARRATSYGREVARELGRELAEAGVMVVAGMSFGIDACAHRGALEVGQTVAVLGCGPDVAYPAAHRSIWRRIQENGLVLSELPPGTGAWRWSFTARARLIAALANVTVCVEATAGSGSLAATDAAELLGRRVGAVPGPVTSRASSGSNNLLAADGQVVLVRDASDVLALGEVRPAV